MSADGDVVREALNVENWEKGIRGCEAVFPHNPFQAFDGMKRWVETLAAEIARLEARLEAAERERDEAADLEKNADPIWEHKKGRIWVLVRRLTQRAESAEAELAEARERVRVLEEALDPFLVIMDSHPEAGAPANAEMRRAATRFREALAALNAGPEGA